ncbi:MAG TPA: hypothetical protein VEQ63_07395, partial [Bryobacteraceae bacterium]|nr:hypothetical protein [Bryobacteraceae bacterium]
MRSRTCDTRGPEFYDGSNHRNQATETRVKLEEMWHRTILATLLFCAVGQAATVRLYLKDGGFHSVREYQKLNDRVRYY